MRESSPGNTRFFLSSRLHIKVDATFPDLHSAFADRDAPSEDMIRYIEKEVNLRYNFPLSWNHSGFKDRLENALKNYANRSFRWVELQLDIFFDERLPFETEEDVRMELQSLESGSSIPGHFVDQKARLNAAYDKILNNRRKTARTTIVFALRWVLCSQKTFRVKELVEATVLSLEHASTEVASCKELGRVSSQEVRQLCSNFIQLGDDISFAKFSHHSVKEYLLDTDWYMSSPSYQRTIYGIDYNANKRGVQIYRLGVARNFLIALKGLPSGIGDTTGADSLTLEKAERDIDERTMELIKWAFSHLSPDDIRTVLRFPKHYTMYLGILGVIKKHFDKLPEYLQSCELAIEFGSDGVAFLDFIFRKVNKLFITDEIVGMAARSQGSEELLEVILRHRRDIPITENILIQAARNQEDGDRAIKVLVEHDSGTIQISGEVLRAASSNSKLGWPILDYLFRLLKEAISISEDVMVMIAAQSLYPMNFFKALLTYRQETRITGAVILAIAKSKRLSQTKEEGEIELLLSHVHEISLTENILVPILRSPGFGLKTLNHLEKEQAIHITSRIVSTALMTADFGLEEDRKYLKSLLDRCPDSYIDVGAAASNRWYGYEAICMIQNSKNDMKIENRVVEAAAGNDRSGKRILELIFEHAPDMEISDYLLEIAAKKGNAQGLGLLLDRIDQSRVTDELLGFLLKAAVGCAEYDTDQVVKEILDRAENVLIAAAQSSGGSMGAILSDWKHDIQISPAVLKAVASNERWKFFSIMQILLHRYGDIEITEDVMEAARNNKTMRSVLTALLRKHQKQHNLSSCDNDEWPYGLDTLFRNYE
ncbi:hypothetical protein ABKA04_002798 [Annulohypoxylon sp. FPYF3050]